MSRVRRPAGGARPFGPLAAIVALAIGLWALAIPMPVRAADPVFGTPTMEATFGEGVVITQPVTLDAAPSRVELLLRTGGDTAPLVLEVPGPAGGGRTTLRHTVSTVEGHILPNTPLQASWRITPGDGRDPVTGPTVDTVYDDDRFDWQTVEGDVVRVHWYEGSRAFAERALRIGEDAVAATSELLGVTEDEPVDFFIYPEQAAFYDALGPGTRENVGGQANADIRTLFALIGPNEIDDPWVGIVVPHELVHLVFDTAVGNPYHFPPRWLNEGLAVYLSQGFDASDRRQVESAAGAGSLIPLEGLGGQFPTTAERFFLAYAESVSAVDFFIRTHGQDALVALIGSYADGRTDDEAFGAAIGMDVAAFDAAWMADLDARPPTRHGPEPAPPGPEPSAWAVDAGGSTGGPAAPTDAGAAPIPSAAPGGADPTPSGDEGSTGLLLVIAVTVVVTAVGLVAVRRRRPPEAAT
jgi:hypothetical protein